MYSQLMLSQCAIACANVMLWWSPDPVEVVPRSHKGFVPGTSDAEQLALVAALHLPAGQLTQ